MLDRENALKAAFDKYSGGTQGLESEREPGEAGMGAGEDLEEQAAQEIAQLRQHLDNAFKCLTRLEAIEVKENGPIPQESMQAREQEPEGGKEPQAEINGAGMSS